jgi:hypothetical protein
MPPSFSGGLLCAKAAVVDNARTDARTPENIRLIKASLRTGRIRGGLNSVAAIMPEGVGSGKALAGAGGMLLLCAAGIFRKAEWIVGRRRRVSSRS